MAHSHHASPTGADILYESFFSGAIGGTVLAVVVLLMDGVAGQPFFTPSLLGGVLFLGESVETVAGFNLEAVAYMTVVHFLAFVVFGWVAAAVVRRLERWTGGGFAIAGLALLGMLEGGSLVAMALFMPGVEAVIGQGTVLLANVVTAAAMTVFLRQAHCSAESEIDLGVESPAVAL